MSQRRAGRFGARGPGPARGGCAQSGRRGEAGGGAVGGTAGSGEPDADRPWGVYRVRAPGARSCAGAVIVAESAHPARISGAARNLGAGRAS